MRITTSIAKRLVNNYKQNHWTVINGSCPSLNQNPAFPNVQDSRSVWFDLNDLQQFIALIGTQNASGIRIYFGEYSSDVINDIQNGQNPLPNSVAGLYTGLHTLVVIPTRNVNGVNTDFNPCGTDYSDPGALSAFNHGELNPPPFNNNAVAAAQATAGNGQLFMLFCDQNP